MTDAAHGIRQLVLIHGRDQAREMVAPEKRSLVDIAAEVLLDDAQRIGITYTGFCLTALPHKRVSDDIIWEKRGHRVTLVVEPGVMQINGMTRRLGVPYGARARMILFYLQTEAIRTGSREVELGRSMRGWLGRMGISYGGRTGAEIREQAARIAACGLKFFWQSDDNAQGWHAGRFVNSGLRLQAEGADDRQADLWEERVVLDQAFFDALREHPIPLQEAALRQLGTRSASLDIYVWLAYRLHSLARPMPISWAALRGQFGGSYLEAHTFRRDFRKALAPAVAAYPDARVEANEEGVILHQSPPPVAPRIFAMPTFRS